MWGGVVTICEFVRILEKADKGIIPRRTLISGIMTEINCQERYRRGLAGKGEAERRSDRKYHGYWRDWA